MDISKFNQELSKLIKTAKIYEKGNDFKSAINIWVKVSEMSLNASKDGSLEAAFRKMLMDKTEQIISHIKELKSGEANTLREEAAKMIPLPKPPKEAVKSKEKDIREEKKPLEDSLSNKKDTNNLKPQSEVKNSDFKNIPTGFQEIKPTSNFEIITPHDPDYVKKRKEEADKIQMSSPKEEEKDREDIMPSSTTPNDDINTNGNIICFACGFEQPADSKVCGNCGTKLK